MTRNCVVVVACLAVGSIFAQDVCAVFGEPIEYQNRQSETGWKYIYTAVHLHGEALEDFIVFDAITDANERFSSSEIQLSLVDVLYHPSLPDVCFPNHYAAMEEYILPLQYPTEYYLNIHVFPEFCGSILGFAFLWYQLGQDADGVYVRTDCFGRQGEHLLLDRNLNATLIHELGHYFSLFHVFQGIEYCGESEEDCSVVNDRVCDTAPTKLNWNCENPICPPSIYDYTPNNYMDYYVDSCKTAFTMGQRNRMQTILPQWRPDIVHNEPYCSGDINNDMSVDVLDLLLMFTCYGSSANAQADINKDGIVSVSDLTTLLSQWSIAC